MKRNGKILNARDVRLGRALIRRGADWAGVPHRALLGRGAAFAAKFTAVVKTVGPLGISQADVGLLVEAAYYGPQRAARLVARVLGRPWHRWAWEIPDADRRLAAAIRAAGELH